MMLSQIFIVVNVFEVSRSEKLSASILRFFFKCGSS
uniref:Uncharacterized protein n=1 Tax=Angiostrongylus cantonensis TaxID=6313 RepID=A0A0K0DEZ3_ANGCA